MHLAAVTSVYPSLHRPAAGAFVQEFVRAVAGLGHRCSVINPIRFANSRKGLSLPARSKEKCKAESVAIYRPGFLSVSAKRLGPWNTGFLTQAFFNRAVLRTVSALCCPPDLIYGHFLYESGYAAVKAARLLGVPSIIGFGEDGWWSLDVMGFERARHHFAAASGFIAVSSLRKKDLIEHLAVCEEKIFLAPNGINLDVFRPINRSSACAKHGFPDTTFNIAFVGSFDERKGVSRLVQAVQGITGVRLIMVGEGEADPISDKVLFKNTVPHELVPELLACADIFVLPTTSEGSCNAVLEAMACGLPIITSRGQYMDDIVDDEVAIRVDPTDIGAIRAAVLALLSEPARRSAMSSACLLKASKFDIKRRATRILTWAEALCEKEAGMFSGSRRPFTKTKYNDLDAILG